MAPHTGVPGPLRLHEELQEPMAVANISLAGYLYPCDSQSLFEWTRGTEKLDRNEEAAWCELFRCGVVEFAFARPLGFVRCY